MATREISEDGNGAGGSAAVHRGAPGGRSGNRKEVGVRAGFRRKRFTARASVLTDLYKNDHIRTLYNLFTACFVLLFINITVNEVAENSLLQIDRHLLLWHFKGVATLFFTWGLMFVSTLVLYNCFRLWAFFRNRLLSSKCLVRGLDVPASLGYGCFMLLLLCGPPALILRVPLAPVTTAVIIIEQLRMMMKTHAFVRSNLQRAMGGSGDKVDDVEAAAGGQQGQTPSAGSPSGVPDFGHFLYFHFAPTLVYRDSYPRSPSLRWRVVCWHACEVCGVGLVCMAAFEHLLLHPLRAFWTAPPSVLRAAALLSRCLLPGLAFLLLGFYVFFHAWMNAWAELLRFADRRFYEAWWTTTKFSNYYRSWNLIVHDWMYEYIYLDLVLMLSDAEARAAQDGDCPQQRPRGGGGCRCDQFACKALVFLISAVFHEYVVALCLRFLYPVLFVMFGVIGVALMYVPVKKGALGNLFMWLALGVGVAVIMSAYCVEYYARKPSSPCASPTQDAILDLIIPRSWTCNGTLQV